MKQGRFATLNDLETEVMRQSVAKEDALVNTQCMEYTVDGSLQHMAVVDRESKKSLLQVPMNDIAHQQLGSYLDIPSKYYNRMRQEDPQLLAVNINNWLQRREPEQRLIRMLDGRMRAFLSNSYNLLENDRILYMVLPILKRLGSDAQVESCEITERRLYIKVVNRRIQAEVTPGDIVQSGVIITNSEVGMGSVTVKPLVYRLVCKNGMVINDAVQRTVHKGSRKVSSMDFTVYKEDTVAAQTEALYKEIRDSVDSAISQVVIDKVTQRYRAAKKMEITGNIPALVTMTRKEFKLREDEEEKVMEHLYQGRDYSLYGLSNAITRASQDVVDYDRATDLESIGYNVLTMPHKQWDRLNVAKDAQLVAA